MTTRSPLIAWIKTLKLSVPFYMVLLPIVSAFWCAVIGAVITKEPPFVTTAAFLGLIAVVVYLVQWGVWVLFLKLLWSDPPRWLRAAPWHRQPIHFGVGLVAALPLALVLILHIPVGSQLYSKEAIMDFFTMILLRYSWIWVGCVVALYSLVKRWLD
jgi:hypothetical protein